MGQSAQRERARSREADGLSGPQGLSPRALLLSLALLVLVLYGGFYAGLVYSSSAGASAFATGVPPMAPLVLLLVLTAVNPLAPRLGWRGLSRRELLAIYAVVSVGAPLLGYGILPWMLAHDLAPRYVARVTPEYETFLGYLPDWFSTPDVAATEGFFLGAPHVPWGLWLAPAAAWCSFLLALFLCTLSLMVLFGQQWIVNERLSFPIAQVPLQVVQEDVVGGRAVGRLPTGSVFWLGVLIPVALALTNLLSSFFPAIPAIHYSVRDEKALWQPPETGPFAWLPELTSVFDPWIIAMAYLLPKEISFSCWFFRYVRVGLTILAVSLGASEAGEWKSDFPAPYHQAAGAALAVVGLVFWSGRRHLARAFRAASGREPRDRELGDAGLYRWALAIFVVSLAYMSYFCWLAGARPFFGIALVVLILVLYVAWARVRAETGLSFLELNLKANSMITIPLGSAFLRPREAVVLIGLQWAYYPMASSGADALTGNSLEALKIGEAAELARRPLLQALVAGFILSLVLGTYLLLTGAYHYGLDNMHVSAVGWLRPQLRYVGDRMYELIATPVGPDTNGVIAMGAGAIVTIALGLLRLRFWWWPFHPLGYLAANCWGMHWYWLPFFIGWVAKTLTLRYGGLRLYRRMIPLAVGLIMGDMVGRAIWQASNILLGRTG